MDKAVEGETWENGAVQNFQAYTVSFIFSNWLQFILNSRIFYFLDNIHSYE
jgi:hypothetical protein